MIKRTSFHTITLIVALTILGCRQTVTSEADSTTVLPTATVQPTTPTETAVSSAPETSTETTTEEVVGAHSTAPSQAVPSPETTVPTIVPIDVTYLTPAQAEGPYYTVEKPADRDNNLTVLTGATAAPLGQVVEFSGKVYDVAGMPIPDIVIEIWQTDANGVYLHPNDPGTNRRDVNFQFYGEAITAVDGYYTFRTILPGQYEPRPRHIHVKVKYNEQTLLTTQFYFANDPDLADEGMFARIGEVGQHLIITLAEGQDVDGSSILVGERDIILAADLSSD